MVDYSIFPLDEEIKDKLAKLEISYAFQPIFYPNGMDIYAYEALMRPKNIGVMDLIEEFRIKNDLHTLEVATIFGAVQCYAKRGYHSYIAINSFPAMISVPLRNSRISPETISSQFIQSLPFLIIQINNIHQIVVCHTHYHFNSSYCMSHTMSIFFSYKNIVIYPRYLYHINMKLYWRFIYEWGK